MVDLVAELAERAKSLAPEDRARLAEELLASLDPHDAEVDAALDAELRHRIDEIERDEAQMIPADQAFAAVRQALRR